jgi:hypothetical protein
MDVYPKRLKGIVLFTDVQTVESESLPAFGSVPAYDRHRGAGLNLPEHVARPVPRQLDAVSLERLERRLVKSLRGCGAAIVHDVVVPSTATTIDHLCITPHGITAIDIEREPDGYGREALIARLGRESDAVATLLADALVEPEQISAAVCRAARPEPLRATSVGSVKIGGPRTVAKIARRARPGKEVDVQLVLAVVRSRLGHEHQRAHRVTRPDGFPGG